MLVITKPFSQGPTKDPVQKRDERGESGGSETGHLRVRHLVALIIVHQPGQEENIPPQVNAQNLDHQDASIDRLIKRDHDLVIKIGTKVPEEEHLLRAEKRSIGKMREVPSVKRNIKLRKFVMATS